MTLCLRVGCQPWSQKEDFCNENMALNFCHRDRERSIRWTTCYCLRTWFSLYASMRETFYCYCYCLRTWLSRTSMRETCYCYCLRTWFSRTSMRETCYCYCLRTWFSVSLFYAGDMAEQWTPGTAYASVTIDFGSNCFLLIFLSFFLSLLRVRF